MAGVQDTGVIDVVAHDPDADEYLLVMVEDRPWGSEPEQAQQLRAKINTYVWFVLDGGLQQHYPETTGQRIRLQVDCVSRPPQEICTIVDHASKQLADYGMRLVVNVRA
jgi:hypothetical protein